MNNRNHHSESEELLIREVTKLVSSIAGVQFGDNQTSMVRYRLLKRISELEMSSPLEYLQYMREHLDHETKVLVSLLTTHHTFFFREFAHFDFLEHNLPKMIENARKQNRKVIRVWSAACSRGQEAYSLSMFLHHHLSKMAPDFTYEILGTDVDEHSVHLAQNGVYRWEEIKEVPSIYLMNHWVRGTEEIKDYVKAKKNIKAPCQFATMNLLDSYTVPRKTEMFDLILCRNVFIYFNPDQIKKSVETLMEHLSPDGLLIVGLSETLQGMSLKIENAGPSVFCREGEWKTSPQSVKKSAEASPAAPSLFKVLCVDDSPTVISLMKKILTKENGYEVVATAANGVEAAEVLKKVKVDVMTLDIHMPKQNGIEYLKANFKAGHPPVVVVSSISREEADLGIKALQYGASDYVEKPSLQNMALKADEIRSKLKTAVRTGGEKKNKSSDLEKSFKRSIDIKDLQKKARILITGVADREKVMEFLKATTPSEPATFVIFFGAAANMLPSFKELFKASSAKTMEEIQSTSNFEANKIYAGTMESLATLKEKIKDYHVSMLVFGELPENEAQKLERWPRSEIVVEDLGSSELHGGIYDMAAFCVPLMSFRYHSDAFLSRGKVG